MTPGRARLVLLVVAALFSTGGVAIKWTDATSWQVASMRSLVAAVTLALLLQPRIRQITWRVLGVSVAYAATMILFVLANKLTTAANTIFLQSTAPLYLTVLAPWLLKERVGRREVRLMGLLALGLVLVVTSGDTGSVTAPNPGLGNLLASIAGVTWAFTILGLRALGERDGDRVDSDRTGLSVVLGNALAAGFCLPLVGSVSGLSVQDGFAILFLGAVQIGLAYFLLTRAVPHVPALESSLLLLVEPALSALWAWSLLGEAPATLALVGGSVIILGTVFHLMGAPPDPSRVDP